MAAQRERAQEREHQAAAAMKKAEQEERRYQNLQAVLQAETSERQAVLDTQISEMRSQRAQLVSFLCTVMRTCMRAHEHDLMAFASFLVQADVVFFSSESVKNIRPCICVTRWASNALLNAFDSSSDYHVVWRLFGRCFCDFSWRCHDHLLL